MYDSHDIATIIKATAKEKNIVIKQMLNDCKLGSNTMSAMYHGKSIASDSLARIADYLDVSVDYLLGRESTPDIAVLPAKLQELVDTASSLSEEQLSDLTASSLSEEQLSDLLRYVRFIKADGEK